MKRDKVIENIVSFFNRLEWKYNYNQEKGVFTSGLNTNDVIGNINILIVIREHHYRVIVSLASRVDSNHINEVAEYLHRANFGMNNGNFELDYQDGEVRFKTFTYFKGVELSKAFIADSIVLPIMMFARYGKNLMKLMLGEGSPEILIAEAEQFDNYE